MTTANALEPGDPAPWFDANTIAGASTSLGVVAGRWVALCFISSLSDVEAVRILTELLAEAQLFNDDHLVFYGIFGASPPPTEAARLAEVSHKALGFIVDKDGAIARLYDTAGASRLFVLDPLLRVVGTFPIGAGGTPPTALRQFLRDLPAVDDFAGVPLTARPSSCRMCLKPVCAIS